MPSPPGLWPAEAGLQARQPGFFEAWRLRTSKNDWLAFRYNDVEQEAVFVKVTQS
jgi:hypothetical protein